MAIAWPGCEDILTERETIIRQGRPMPRLSGATGAVGDPSWGVRERPCTVLNHDRVVNRIRIRHRALAAAALVALLFPPFGILFVLAGRHRLKCYPPHEMTPLDFQDSDPGTIWFTTDFRPCAQTTTAPPAVFGPAAAEPCACPSFSPYRRRPLALSPAR